MSDKKKGFHEAKVEIEQGLGGLLGALNDALGDMVSKLEDGSSGALERDFAIDTDKGPLRAQAGIRVRMGAMEAKAGPKPKSINPNRDRTTPTPTTPRTIDYDLFASGDGWVLTADVPGITQDELTLAAAGTSLKITTTGARAYAATIPLEAAFDPDRIQTTLKNGILTLQISKEDAP